jgi:threonine dehydrogenase-like Zn-dependent dehydrogenase
MADFVRARASKVYRLDEGIDLEAAALTELYAVSIHAMRRAMVEPADTVVIIGVGKLGLALLDTVKEVGPSLIIACDVQDYRLDIARRIGAHYCINSSREDPVARVMEHTEGVGAAKVFEAVGHSALPEGAGQPMTQAVEMMRSAGRVIVMGQGPDAARILFKPFVLREGEIIASRVNAGEFPRAIRFMAQGRYHPDLLITHRMSLDDAPRGFRLMDEGVNGALKVVLKV